MRTIRNLLSYCITLLLGVNIHAQGIRKASGEMTAAERQTYIDALNAVTGEVDSNDWNLVELIAGFHEDYNTVLHNPSTDYSHQFMPWHRMVVWEMENALQGKSSALTIPYLSPYLYDGDLNDFMDLANFPNLNLDKFSSYPNVDYIRDWGANYWPFYTMGVEEEGYEYLFAGTTNFWNSGMVNGGPSHDQIHFTIGSPNAAMNSGIAPLDPVFFLHHSAIDKFWQVWEDLHPGATAADFSYSGVTGDLNRYDGSVSTLYHNPLPSKSGLDLSDARALGTFYSDEQTAVARLNGSYSVSNTYFATEKFIYPGTIEASDFAVPAGKSAYINSSTAIVLKSGFSSQGSLVLKVGGYDDNFPSSLLKARVRDKTVAQAQPEAGISGVARTARSLQVDFRVDQAGLVVAEAFDAQGRLVGSVRAEALGGVGNHLIVPIRNATGPLYLRLKAGSGYYRKIVTPI